MARSKKTSLPPILGPDPVEAYARGVVSGDIIAGPLVRAACQRHLNDLQTGHQRGLTWDSTASGRAIKFFPDVLRLSEGEFSGKPFALQSWQKFIIGSLFGWKGSDGFRRFRTAYIEIGKGNGKALALDTPIPTPSGWTDMDSLRVGDMVFDEYGHPCRVTAVTDIVFGRPCYNVRFSDGDEIVADALHLWKTSALRSGGTKGPKAADLPRKGGYALRTTEEIARTLAIAPSTSAHPQAKWNHRVDIAGLLDLPDIELPIPPYSLGAWLGDGNSADARLTCAFADDDILAEIRAEGISVDRRAKHSVTTGRFILGSNGKTQIGRNSSLQDKLRRFDLLNNKHIPSVYFRAGTNQRMALLQGLMDTDGSALKDGAAELCLCSRRLAEDAIELMRTLGFKPMLTECAAVLNGREVGRRYRIRLHARPDRSIFRLARKTDRLKVAPVTSPLSNGRMIIGCDPVESVPVKCISVDSPSRMYLAGKHLVPTHNSPMAGGIGLYMLAADKEAGAEVYAAATMRDQARILFRDAAHMVDYSPELTKRIQKSGIKEVLNLAHLESGSFFRPVSSEGRGLDGKRVHCALIDEVHEHPTAVVVAKMRAGTKGRRQALIVEITNSGFDRNTICYQHHEHSQRVVTGLVEDDTWFAYVCGLDEGEDPLVSDECWVKANPNIGISITRKYLEEQVAEARNMPADASRVRRLNFCQWVDADNPAIPQALWLACEVDDIDESELSGLACIGGLDLSGTRDLTALARAYEPDENGVINVIVEFWTPKDTLVERSRADRVPYDQWVDEGHVIATPGRAVDYRFVAQRMSELQSEIGLERVAYDPYRIKYLETELAEIAVDIKLVPHGQGYRKSQESELWMPRSLEQLEGLISSGKLRVKRNPALTFAAASAVHSPDPKGNLIYDKRRSTGRIDGLVAACMAVGSVLVEDGSGSVYSSPDRPEGLLVL